MEAENYLGKKYKDTVTNFVGTCTGYWIRANGTDRILLEDIDTTGRPIDFWVDVDRVSYYC